MFSQSRYEFSCGNKGYPNCFYITEVGLYLCLSISFLHDNSDGNSYFSLKKSDKVSKDNKPTTTLS